MPARLAMVLLGIPCSWRRRTVCIVTSILSVPRRYRSLYHSNCCTFIIQQNNKIVQKPKVPSFTTDSSVRNDIENTLILFRCNIPISRLCSIKGSFFICKRMCINCYHLALSVVRNCESRYNKRVENERIFAVCTLISRASSTFSSCTLSPS